MNTGYSDEELESRYARGEISREQMEELRNRRQNVKYTRQNRMDEVAKQRLRDAYTSMTTSSPSLKAN
jgi:hypothetical protein